jgi:hypothetical protein
MRIRFAPDDLLRMRFAEEPAPLLDLSMTMAPRGHPPVRHLLARVRVVRTPGAGIDEHAVPRLRLR